MTPIGLLLAAVPLLAPTLAYPVAYPYAFPELDATVSQAMDIHPSVIYQPSAQNFPPSLAYSPKGYRADNGYAADFPDESPPPPPTYQATYPVGLPYDSQTSCAAFGAGSPVALQNNDGRDISFDDRPFPGDATASLDTGLHHVPLGPGERLVLDEPYAVDDTEEIPLAGLREAALVRSPRHAARQSLRPKPFAFH